MSIGQPPPLASPCSLLFPHPHKTKKFAFTSFILSFSCELLWFSRSWQIFYVLHFLSSCLICISVQGESKSDEWGWRVISLSFFLCLWKEGGAHSGCHVEIKIKTTKESFWFEMPVNTMTSKVHLKKNFDVANCEVLYDGLFAILMYKYQELVLRKIFSFHLLVHCQTLVLLPLNPHRGWFLL